MGITKDYLRYVHSGSCGCVGSTNGEICAIDANTCAVTACENVNFYNMRTNEKLSRDKQWQAVGYADGVIRLFNRKSGEQNSVIFSGHKKGVSSLAFSDDGLMLASGGKDCAVIVWDIVSESGLFRLNGHKGPVTHLAFAQDNQFLISSSKDCLIKFWSMKSQSCFYTLFDSSSEVYSFSLLLNETIVVVASGEPELLVYELTWLEDGKIPEVSASEQPEKKKATSQRQSDEGPMEDMANVIFPLTACCFRLALHYSSLRYVRVNVRGKLIRQCKGRALQLAVSHDERLVLCLGSDKIVDVYRVFTEAESSKRLAKKIKIEVTPVRCFTLRDVVSPIHRVFVSQAHRIRWTDLICIEMSNAYFSEGTPAEVDVDDVKRDVTILVTRIGEYRTPSKMKWVDFTPMCKTLESGSTKYSVLLLFLEIWNIITYRLFIHLRAFQVFALMSNNTIHLVNIECDLISNSLTFDCAATLDRHGHRSDVRGLSVSSSNNAVVSGGGDEVIWTSVKAQRITATCFFKLIIWNTHSLRPVASLTNEAMQDITAVIFTRGDGHVVAATKTGELFLWDVAACELLESRNGHEGTIWDLVHTTDGRQLISVSSDKRAKFWTYDVVAEGTRKRLSLRETRILELSDEALCCAVSPNGKFIIIGLLDNTAAVYFSDTLKFFISLYGHSLPVTCVTVSPVRNFSVVFSLRLRRLQLQDSKLVVTGSADKSIKIWGLDFGDCHKSFHAHDDVVTAVMFSPSDEMLVWSAGRDGKIKQWDAQKMCRVQVRSIDAQEMCRVQVLDRHSAEIRALSQTDSGHLMFSASHDKSLRCWELTEEVIVVEEEEEMEREKDYEARLIDEEDVVSGEVVDPEAGLASVKSSQSIVSAENIIEAVDIVRNERVQQGENTDHKPHPLLGAYNSKSFDHFIVDVISKCRPSNLERSLLLVPLSYTSDILSALSECIQKRYKVEFCVRIAIFLIRVHQNYIINSTEMLPVLEKISAEMPRGIVDVRDITGFNMAALELLRLELEEAQGMKMFADVSDLTGKPKKKKKDKERKAVIKT
ncbi:unnamed protein product [Heligmosomoides polygyrus]|uniref:Utp12 domain-containing protein n=1 Tax=Heligmosomoides polygyrus TaxID=6339 RepID=A0A183FEH8_HELPZ|nr:unnamed protein product [Heligmosomoides polygyrus]